MRHAAIGLLALTAASTLASAQTQTPIERGSYLVNTILTCGNCHTPKGPQGDIMEKAFSGGLEFDEPPFKVTASNITSDKETGIGDWSAEELTKFMTTGVRPNGVQVAAIMPTGYYKIMTARDLDAVVAYLRSLPPLKNTVPAPIYKMPAIQEVPPGGEKRVTEPELSDPVKRGFYLATIGHCFECHTPMVQGQHDFQNAYGMGGMKFPGPWGKSVAANITQSKTKGIGAWSDDEIKRAITTGISRDGHQLKPPMGFPYYAKMTAADLDAIVAYLRTVPAKD